MASACAIASETGPESVGIDPIDFRRVLGQFCSGVVVVAGNDDGAPAGFTCQSFFSLSLDPPLVAFSPARTSASYPAIRRSGAFCINILADAQRGLCSAFARSGVDKWSGVNWRPGVTGSPIIDGSIAAIDCEIWQEHETGDHHLVIGRVVALELTGGSPLLFHDGQFGRFALGIGMPESG